MMVKVKMITKPGDRLFLSNSFSQWPQNPVNSFARLLTVNMLMTLFFYGFSPLVNADTWDELQSHDTKVHEYDEDFYEFEDAPWKEAKALLPAYPDQADLVAITGPAEYKNYDYLIDVKNLRVDPDGVVRYTIVIRAPGGSQNVMFEGLKCASGEYKTYAYGQANKFFSRKSVSWRPVSSRSAMGYTRNLANSYFCNNLGEVLKQHEIVKNIKYGKGTVDGLYIE